MKPQQKAIKKPLKQVNANNEKISNEESDENLSIEDIIYSKGYPLEIHNVYTEDGYLIRLFRIPGGKNELDYKNKRKPPVYFHHGIFDSADCWVCNTEENCYSFILANKGFDVWLGNSRGNKHSKHHKLFTTDTPEFWSFSFYEMGKYELPSVFDYISRVNKSGEKIIYIGHSQGTTILFSALTHNLEYFKSKIKLFIAFAPVTTLNHLDSNLFKLGNVFRLDFLMKRGKISELLPEDEEILKMNMWMYKRLPYVVHYMLDLATDKNSKVCNNPKRMKVLYGHYPSGGSFKSINHYIQIFRKKRFCYYDYGPEANMAIYNQIEPKDFDLENIKDIPIALIVGKEDRLSNIEDAKLLKSKLLENVKLYMEVDNLGHTGFIVGNDISWFKNRVMKLIVECSSSCLEILEPLEQNKNVEKADAVLNTKESNKKSKIIEREFQDKSKISINRHDNSIIAPIENSNIIVRDNNNSIHKFEKDDKNNNEIIDIKLRSNKYEEEKVVNQITVTDDHNKSVVIEINENFHDNSNERILIQHNQENNIINIQEKTKDKEPVIENNTNENNNILEIENKSKSIKQDEIFNLESGNNLDNQQKSLNWVKSNDSNERNENEKAFQDNEVCNSKNLPVSDIISNNQNDHHNEVIITSPIIQKRKEEENNNIPNITVVKSDKVLETSHISIKKENLTSEEEEEENIVPDNNVQIFSDENHLNKLESNNNEDNGINKSISSDNQKDLNQISNEKIDNQIQTERNSSKINSPTNGKSHRSDSFIEKEHQINEEKLKKINSNEKKENKDDDWSDDD
jgi:lysosomal acid lipase/cholesteryl ester hydrolase